MRRFTQFYIAGFTFDHSLMGVNTKVAGITDCAHYIIVMGIYGPMISTDFVCFGSLGYSNRFNKSMWSKSTCRARGGGMTIAWCFADNGGWHRWAEAMAGEYGFALVEAGGDGV